MTIEPVAEINWQRTRMTRLPFNMRQTAAGPIATLESLSLPDTKLGKGSEPNDAGLKWVTLGVGAPHWSRFARASQ